MAKLCTCFCYLSLNWLSASLITQRVFAWLVTSCTYNSGVILLSSAVHISEIYTFKDTYSNTEHPLCSEPLTLSHPSLLPSQNASLSSVLWPTRWRIFLISCSSGPFCLDDFCTVIQSISSSLAWKDEFCNSAFWDGIEAHCPLSCTAEWAVIVSEYILEPWVNHILQNSLLTPDKCLEMWAVIS